MAMDETMSGEVFKRYRFVNGHRALSGCLYCQGAIFPGYEPLGPNGMKVYKCFQCGRMYLNNNGHLKLWPYREYEHLSHAKNN